MVDEAVYPGLRQVAEIQCAALMPVPVDATGTLDLAAAEHTLRSGPPPGFLYTIPVGHNPLGSTMSISAKLALIGLARRHGLCIVEDDVYGFLQYDDPFAFPLRSLDDERVFYVGSFSKIVAPGLRVGWIIAPRRYMTTLSVLKEALDINMSTLAQRILCRYLDTGKLANHIARLRAEYRVRRDAMQEALTALLPNAQWITPSAGFFFWVRGVGLGDTDQLLEHVLTRGVAFVPGSAFFTTRTASCRNAMRLNFSYCSTALIREGIRRIGVSIRERACNITSPVL